MRLSKRDIEAMALQIILDGEPLWASELSRIMKISVSTASKILKRLRRSHGLKRRKIGNAKVYFNG